MSRLEKESLDVESGRLCLYRVEPTGERRGTVLVPPLIGGSGLQQYLYFRGLSRRGYELVLFDYRAHARSTGRFSFRSSIGDTAAVVRHVRGSLEGEPLFGVADCYGAIPLLRAAAAAPDDFAGLALFSPVPSLRHITSFREVFAAYWRPGGRWRLRNPLDHRGLLFETTSRLFPDIDQSRDHFGILDYGEARRFSMIFDYFFYSPLRGVRVEDVPALIVYGRHDELLHVGDEAGDASYRRAFERLLGDVRFRLTEAADHYWTGVSSIANDAAADFFGGLAGDREDVLVPAARREPDVPAAPAAKRSGGERRPEPVHRAS